MKSKTQMTKLRYVDTRVSPLIKPKLSSGRLRRIFFQSLLTASLAMLFLHFSSRVYAEASQTAKIDYSEELKKIIATDPECADIYNQMQDWKDPELRDESAYNFFLLLFKAREIADKLAPEIKIDSDITKYTDNLYGSTGFLCGYISNFPQWNKIAIL